MKTFHIGNWGKSNKKSLQDIYPAKDEYQVMYRKEFEGIIDKYLICHESDDRRKLIVYIDAENDIDWIIKDEQHDEERDKKRQAYITKLDAAQAFPVSNLSDSNIVRFKIILGAGYNAALHDNYELVQPSIDKALNFIKERNMEESRYLILSCSTLLILIFILLSLIIGSLYFIHYKEWIIGILLGITGAYVSIWNRSGKMDLTGLGTKRIHYLEAFARLFCGGIFAYIGMLLIKSNLLSSIYTQTNAFMYIITFIAGFNERFIATIIEHITNTK